VEKLKVYIAGKVSKNSVFGTEFWRDDFCKELSEKTGMEIINLDPTSEKSDNFDSSNSSLIFGRDCYMIKQSDIVIVNLTDDISVGGSQEMLIAKYFKKPLLGIARKGGKFRKKETELFGKKVKNWIHPFVAPVVDELVEDINQASEWIRNNIEKIKPKSISIIDENIDYYLENFHEIDEYMKKIEERI
jgi:nucleoside 2-deoxyribosyltransferase